MTVFEMCKYLINANRTVGLQDKIDVFFVVGRLTDVEYTELCGMLPKSNVEV